MDKKTLANIAAFGLCFLLWLKFGPEIFWLILAIGFVFVVLVTVFTVLFQILFLNYFEKKFLPGFKRITGREFPLGTIPEESRNKIKAGISRRKNEGDLRYHYSDIYDPLRIGFFIDI